MSTILRFALLISVLGRMIAGTSTGYTIQTVAGGESIGDNGPGVQALLQTVEGVTADRLGFYYFADTDSHRIRRMSPSGTIVTIACHSH